MFVFLYFKILTVWIFCVYEQNLKETEVVGWWLGVGVQVKWAYKAVSSCQDHQTSKPINIQYTVETSDRILITYKPSCTSLELIILVGFHQVEKLDKVYTQITPEWILKTGQKKQLSYSMWSQL